MTFVIQVAWEKWDFAKDDSYPHCQSFMDPYLILIYVLLATAIVDLVVGVSNDAVNFLNSAVGSKAAPLRTILIVASVGVVVGCTFSSGMMEVARNGLFNPSFFTFDRVMIIFMAVMLTDIILLDIYNSLGLPTSTTVSLVFEILGAAFVTGILLSYDRNLGFPDLHEVINVSSAITIISGIFLSVLLSFVFGSIIQHILRIIFSFDLETSLKKYGALFSGIAITSIVYFLLIKGAKGSFLVTNEQVSWIMENTRNILIVSVVVFSILVQSLMWWKKINPLKFVVLLGTFSLAMAFAANDLVNFIGVPVAGLISFQSWQASGLDPAAYSMDILKGQVSTPYWLLLIAGVIMVITLWTNAKARKVTQTEVSLGRQEEGDELFKSNIVSRAIVGSSVQIGEWVDRLVPPRISGFISARFAKLTNLYRGDREAPSFDLLRASINLLVSSMLIAYGTSKKLPLSTTFVTFMVAMGTSFADMAWGRESAVYRVAGVVNVIASWLITAVVAFTSAGTMALIIYHTGFIGFFALAAAAIFLLIRSHILFNQKQAEEKVLSQVFQGGELDIHQMVEESKASTTKNLKSLRKIMQLSLRALNKGDRNTLVKSNEEVLKLKEQNEKLHHKIIKYVRRIKKGHLGAGRLYILVFDQVQHLYQRAHLISEITTNHIINHHSVPKGEFQQIINELESKISAYVDMVAQSIEGMNFEDEKGIEEQCKKLQEFIRSSLDVQIQKIQQDELGNRMGLLQVRILLAARDIVTAVTQIRQLYREFAQPPSSPNQPTR
ncbi:MAG: inorganic phosphate transporter [Cyclobacteriaceae bacterium]|nr:inorganic phosphate transporter [Cyclobacteriaceae bacterium]